MGRWSLPHPCLYQPFAFPSFWPPYLQGECMVLPCVTDAEAEARGFHFRFVDVPSGKRYLRITPDPITTPNP